MKNAIQRISSLEISGESPPSAHIQTMLRRFDRVVQHAKAAETQIRTAQESANRAAQTLIECEAQANLLADLIEGELEEEKEHGQKDKPLPDVVMDWEKAHDRAKRNG